MSERSVVVRIRAEIGDFRRQMGQVAEATRQAGQASQDAGAQASTGLGRLASSAHHHEQAWNTAGTSLLTFGTAVVAGVGLAIAKFAEFDKAMSEVSAATHASAGDMDLLRAAAVSAGADTAFSAKEAADAITELSKAGVSTADILNGGLDGALSLAAAGSMAVADAAELAATAMTQFKLQGDDLPHVADLLAAGAGKAQGSVEDLGMALKQGGLIAASTGLSIEETTGGLAAFASAGLLGSDAGTSFKTMLQSLTPNSVAAKEEMERLGFSAVDADGNFKSLSQIAGGLQTSMKGLTEAERAASMEIIFGSDAVRAANVLYEQGAKGVDEWTKKVNVAGYAAATASIKQDNLAGDLEKLGGSFDTVLIKGGSGAAQALRGVVQGAEDLIDGLGKVDPELISLSVGMAGVVGASALLGGGFLTLFPKVLQVHAAFKTLQTTNSGLAGGLGKVAKGAGIAAAALAALSIAGAVFSEKSTKSASDYANAILKVANAGKDAKASDLDSIFQGFDKFGGQDTVNGVNGVADAVKRLANPDFNQTVDQFFDGFASGVLNLPKSDLGQLEDRLKGVGDELGNIVANGGATAAAKSFNLLTKEFEANGKSAQDALDKMPGYKNALLEQAQAVGVNLEPAELLMLAQGRIPAVMQAVMDSTQQKATADETAKAASEAHAEALADLGLNADGTIASLEKYTTALFNAGLSTMGAREAEAAHEAAIDNTKKAVEDATAAIAADLEAKGMGAEAAKAQAEAQMGLGAALNKNKTDFDRTTEAGRILNAQFQSVASTGMAEIEAKAKAGAGQPELQKNLSDTFTALKQSGVGMGLTAGAADVLARKVMGIPPKANINTWMSDEAKRMAEATEGALKRLDGKTVNTYVVHHERNVIENVVTTSHGRNNTGGRQGTKPTFQAEGGAIYGSGTGTSDDIPAMLSNGEHVLTAAEVQKMGGQAAVYRMRAMAKAGTLPKFASGGAVARRQYRAEQLEDLLLDASRRQTYRTVDDSLSSGYSFSDRLRSVAESGNVPNHRARLMSRANSSDAALRTLHARSESLSKSLDKAKDRMNDLVQVRGQVANALSGEFNIGKTAQRQGLFGAGAVGETISEAKGFLAKVQGFAGKLKRLQKKGFSGAIIQEVAALGTTAGTQAADSLLQATAGQVKDLNKTMIAIDTASMAAGSAVTDSMFKGGVAGAAAVVNGIASQQGAIGRAMLQIGLGMENALRSALGGKTIKRAGGGAVYGPGTGTSDEVPALLSNGEHVLTAEEVRKMGGHRAVYRFRDQLDRMQAPSKSLAGGYGQVQSVPGYSPHWGAAAGQPAAGPVTNNWTIYDQQDPVATSHEVSRRQRSLST